MRILKIGRRVVKWFSEHIKRGLNPKDDPYSAKINQVTAIFIGPGTTKSQNFERVSKNTYQSFSRITRSNITQI